MGSDGDESCFHCVLGAFVFESALKLPGNFANENPVDSCGASKFQNSEQNLK